jgi:hypothetical protein
MSNKPTEQEELDGLQQECIDNWKKDINTFQERYNAALSIYDSLRVVNPAVQLETKQTDLKSRENAYSYSLQKYLNLEVHAQQVSVAKITYRTAEISISKPYRATRYEMAISGKFNKNRNCTYKNPATVIAKIDEYFERQARQETAKTKQQWALEDAMVDLEKVFPDVDIEKENEFGGYNIRLLLSSGNEICLGVSVNHKMEKKDEKTYTLRVVSYTIANARQIPLQNLVDYLSRPLENK